MLPLAGKRALVCGGSQGIGRACAVELAARGAEITLVARTESTLKSTVSELAKSGRVTHRHLCADSADPDVVRSKVANDIENFGDIQILINNTGGPPHGAITDATAKDFLTALMQHILCNQLLAQTLLPGMKRSGYGRIVNIISTSVIQPIRGLGVSNTTRGAVANWARTWAAELAPLGITVNNVLPGYTATERLNYLFQAKAEKAGTTVDEVKRQIVEAIPMGRLGDPAEIGRVVAFLASPAASYVTGVNLPVDGGRTAVQ